MAYDSFKAALGQLKAAFTKIAGIFAKAEQVGHPAPSIPAIREDAMTAAAPDTVKRTIPASAIGHTHDGVSSTGITVPAWCRKRGVSFTEDQCDNLIVELAPHQVKAFDRTFDETSYLRPARPDRPTGKPDPAPRRDGPKR